MTSYRRALANACKSAGLPVLNPHALRHTGATRLALAGVERRTTQAIGGWRTGEMLDEIYEHTCDDRQAEVAARYEVRRGVSAPATATVTPDADPDDGAVKQLA
jgi:integrase